MRFSELTRVARTGDDTFAVEIEPSGFIVRGPNGGYLAAVLLRALVERIDDATRPPRSLTVHYPAVAAVGPATITTEVVRAGRSLVTATARLEQDGRPMAVALAAFSPPWPGPGFTDDRRVAPDVAPFAELSPRAEAGPQPPPFVDYWDQRVAIGAPLRSGAARAETGGWLRLRQPEPIDAVLVAAMADAWPPAVFTKLASPSGVPTVDLTVHFRMTLPSPALDADDPVLVRFSTRTLADGFLEEDGELWTPDGSLLAESRQLAILLPIPG